MHRQSLQDYADQVINSASSLSNPQGYKLIVIATLDKSGDENDGAYVVRSGQSFTINIAIALLTRALIALAVGKQWESP